MFEVRDRYEIARISGTEADWRSMLTIVDPKHAQKILAHLNLRRKDETNLNKRVVITLSSKEGSSIGMLMALLQQFGVST
jgi:hypothetical protein